MSLSTVIWLLLLCAIGWLFWLRRGVAESAKKHVERYCQLHQLQVISVSLHKTRLTLFQGRPGWHSVFYFEFSGNRADRYQGKLDMLNHMAKEITVPPYRTDMVD